jgi:hypothetical protein
MKRSGVADLPLHGGLVPRWLSERMTRLGTAITEAIVHDYGTTAFLTRLSDPFWFQALGAVMGMDWHSSGITTSVMGALKRGLTPKADELGLYICGGRGRSSRNTPAELRSIATKKGFDGEALVRTSRLTARVDNNAIADGFQIYLHSFVVNDRGDWTVVQQGLNDKTATARRYHWHSQSVQDFVVEPHTGIVGENQGAILNLVAKDASATQAAMLDLVHQKPEVALNAARYLEMPRHHEVKPANVDLKRLGAVLAVAYDTELHDFAELLLLEKLGPRTIQSLALVAEVVHGTPTRFEDPARFSFALGGKDRHPFPVPLKTYDETIGFLRRSLDSAKIEGNEKLDGFRRLERFVKGVETHKSPIADFETLVAHENAISPSLDGRSVGGFARTRKRTSLDPRQRSLF